MVTDIAQQPPWDSWTPQVPASPGTATLWKCPGEAWWGADLQFALTWSYSALWKPTSEQAVTARLCLNKRII